MSIIQAPDYFKIKDYTESEFLNILISKKSKDIFLNGF
jgi:hypothetical protein